MRPFNISARWPVLWLALATLFLGLAGCGDRGSETSDTGDNTPPPVPANVSGPPPAAERSESGLAWVVLEEGTGDRRPTTDDRITVHYTGWQTDGTMFDSSVARGEPATFPLGQLIDGWVEGLQLMTEGERRRFWIPGELAYDNRPDRPDAPKGMLVFDVELIEIENAE